VDAIKALGLKNPQVPAAQKAQLEQAKRQLLAER